MKNLEYAAAGSLTPALEGAARSDAHLRRVQKKQEKGCGEPEAREQKKRSVFLAQAQTR